MFRGFRCCEIKTLPCPLNYAPKEQFLMNSKLDFLSAKSKELSHTPITLVLAQRKCAWSVRTRKVIITCFGNNGKIEEE